MLNQDIGEDLDQDELEEKMEAPLVDYENDPYFASAIEFMYSEDTEDDFGTMDAQQQEALLKKTWLEREKQFYGEEIEEDEEPIIEQNEEEEEDSGDEFELDRGNVIGINEVIKDELELKAKVEAASEEQTAKSTSINSTATGSSRYAIMKQK